MSDDLWTREQVLARDIMSRPVRKLPGSTPLPVAAAFFVRHGISGAPVLDPHGRAVGVFTMTDLARAVHHRLLRRATARTLEKREPVAERVPAALRGLERTTVGELMTVGLYSVFPEAELDEVVRTMSSPKIHRVFVISDRGALEGVITTMDVLRWMDRKFAARKNESRATHRD